MLRHEVAVLGRQVHRPMVEPADRAVPARLARLLPCRRLGHFSVKPETLLRWHRDLVAEHWGYRRIHGELTTMGIAIAPSSVWTIVQGRGIEPSPRRSGPSWTELLSAQAKGLTASDFFRVDTVLLRRLCVLVFIHHDSRYLRIAGVTARPVADWVTQQARNLSMELADHASAINLLIRDRDTEYTASFEAVFVTAGVRVIRASVRAPRSKAICGRVIGTIRRECLDQMLILGRRHLEAVLGEYVEHYYAHRRTALSISVRHPCSMRLRCRSTTSTRPSYEDPTAWAASSTSTG